MDKKIVFTDRAPAPIGPYSQAVVTTGPLVFVAGQIPINPATGQIVDGDIKAQTHRVLENVGAILKEAGATHQSVVKTTVFLRDMNEFSGMNEVYGKFFKDLPPARSTVEVSRLPRDVKVEIEVIAYVKES